MNPLKLLMCVMLICVIEDTSDREKPDCFRPVPANIPWNVKYLPAAEVNRLCNQRTAEDQRSIFRTYRGCTFPRLTTRPGVRKVTKVEDYCVSQFETLIAEEYRDAKFDGHDLIDWEGSHVVCQWIGAKMCDGSVKR